MDLRLHHRGRTALVALLMLGASFIGETAFAETVYKPINPTMSNQTITLTGRDLTIEQVIAVARYGAKVQISPEAKQREADNYGLLLEAATEGVSVYWFNRGAGDQRETVMFSGNPESPENKPKLEASQLAQFKGGAVGGYGPEVSAEDIVGAMMVVRANAMTWNAPSPQLADMLTDLLNKRITPVVQSRGTLGEGDLAQLGNVGAAMVGAGDVYYNGTRMPAAQALQQAGLKPIQPFAADLNALTSSNAYATGQAALLVTEAQVALDWADMAYAMDLNGMNSSITPISMVVQAERPFKWLNWDAARVLDMIKGSYLFNEDPKRIIQDPESLRASSIRQASAWDAWADLRDSVLEQLNSSDHNPAVRTDLGPNDSWELATPQMMKYHVKGGPQSHGKQGYIVSNANWDPYPMANKIEALTGAFANMAMAVTLRIDRFSNPFFTVLKVPFNYEEGFPQFGGYQPVDLWQDILNQSSPITPQGQAIVSTVEDLQAQTRIKVVNARGVVENTVHLLAQDIMTAAYWMDARKKQSPDLAFGPGPTAALTALRKVAPAKVDPQTLKKPLAMTVAEFMAANPVSTIYPGGPAMPATDRILKGTAKR